MNVQDYRAAGYKFSTLVEQPIITRAESDVVAAYIIPLCGIAPTEDERAVEPLKSAIMGLSFLLIMQRNSTETRAGVKTKLSEQSTTPTYEDVLRQYSPSCVSALQRVAPGVSPWKVCSDICGVFFKTNYFYSR